MDNFYFKLKYSSGKYPLNLENSAAKHNSSFLEENTFK